jgi:hypothetical protein
MSRSAVVVGEPLDVFGEAKPGTIVTGVIYSNGAAILSATTTVPVSGTYTLPVPTTSLVPGTYTFLAYAQTSERISAPSRILMFTVGSQSIPRYRDYDSCAFIRGDVNRDCRVNYEDILLAYTWKKAGSGEGLIELESLSGDGKVNMRDFSIILYYWTG